MNAPIEFDFEGLTLRMIGVFESDPRLASQAAYFRESLERYRAMPLEQQKEISDSYLQHVTIKKTFRTFLETSEDLYVGDVHE